MPLAAARKLQRVSTVRSRAGCLTCRRARVKCDESRPRCRRCGRLCLSCSYETRKEASDGQDGGRTLSQESATTLQALKVTTYNIPFHAPGDAKQRKALHYYYSYASTDLAGLMAVGFWDRVVPQKIQTESVVRNAAIALSEAHYGRVFIHPTGQAISSLYGTEAYTKAITALRRYMRSKGQLSREVVLVCCVLFHTIELLRENVGGAKMQMENGIAILKSWQLEADERTMNGEHMYDTTTLFGRLDFSATLDDMTRVPELAHLDSYEAQVSTTSAQLEVRNARDAYTLKVHNGTDRWKHLARYAKYRGLPIDQVPLHVIQEKERLEARHRATDKAVEDLLLRHSTDTTLATSKRDVEAIKTARTLLVVRFQTQMGLHQLAESLQSPCTPPHCPAQPSTWDANPHALLSLAESALDLRVLAKDAQDFQDCGSFSSEVASCCSLLLIAHRTASPEVRKRAVELARRAERQEGVAEVARRGLEWFDLPDEEKRRRGLVVLWSGPGH